MKAWCGKPLNLYSQVFGGKMRRFIIVVLVVLTGMSSLLMATSLEVELEPEAVIDDGFMRGFGEFEILQEIVELKFQKFFHHISFIKLVAPFQDKLQILIVLKDGDMIRGRFIFFRQPEHTESQLIEWLDLDRPFEQLDKRFGSQPQEE